MKMNRAFRIASELVHATVAYHVAARCGDETAIRAAYRCMCDIQNELSAVCEDLAVESPTV